MNTIIKKVTALLLIITLCVLNMLSQTNEETVRIKIGGISINSENHQVLDTCQIGVYYNYTYPQKSESIIEKRSDTLFLAIGKNVSVFLDPLYKEKLEIDRKARFARSRKAKLINNEYSNINDILEVININSDYKEDDPGDPVQIYKNRNTFLVSSIYNSYVDNIQCDQMINQMHKWEIIEETDTIMGYLCQKAKINYSGRNYTAWFAKDIAVNDGPWKFWGLPGLILKCSDDDGLFEWVAIGISNLNADIVKDKVVYEKIHIKGFNNFVKRMTNEIIVSFYNNDVLYMTNKEREYERVPVEILYD